MDNWSRNYLHLTELNSSLLCTQDLKNGRQDQQIEFSAPYNQTS